MSNPTETEATRALGDVHGSPLVCVFKMEGQSGSAVLRYISEVTRRESFLACFPLFSVWLSELGCPAVVEMSARKCPEIEDTKLHDQWQSLGCPSLTWQVFPHPEGIQAVRVAS